MLSIGGAEHKLEHEADASPLSELRRAVRSLSGALGDKLRAVVAVVVAVDEPQSSTEA